MSRAFLAIALILGVVAAGCESDEGTGEIIGPLTYTVSEYTVEGDDPCMAVSEDPPDFVFETFDITIDGSTATLESGEFLTAADIPLGGVDDTYSPEDDTVVFTASFTDGSGDCTVDETDTFTVVLGDDTASLDENTTVEVTWDHGESDGSTVAGACAGVWLADLPCDSQATFTLTQE
jgi:hypothetical protein